MSDAALAPVPTPSLTAPLIALVGNPNCGKTALFNRLTGARQKVGNYAGVTVERKEGQFVSPAGQHWRVLDLPGAYSLLPTTPDETITRDVIAGTRAGEASPVGLVCVVDATNLRLNLRMVLELQSLEVPMVLVINMMDLARKRGIHIDMARLASELGVPVIEAVAVKAGGEQALLAQLDRLDWTQLSGQPTTRPIERIAAIPVETTHQRVGELLGVGSLVVSDALGPDQPALAGNMFVPIDLLKPILDELLAQGRSAQSKRAWMGVNCIELAGEVRVLRVSRAGPAEAAGLKPGDQIVRIDGQTVDSLQTLWHRLWGGGAPERDVALDILRDGRSLRVPLHTVDRQSAIKQPEGT